MMKHQSGFFFYLCFLVLLFLLPLILYGSNQGYSASAWNSEHALKFVQRNVLENSYQDKTFLVSIDQFPKGSEVLMGDGEVIFVRENSFIVFVDDNPFANWEHPCRYMLVPAPDMKRVTIIDAMTPPRERELFEEVETAASRLLSNAVEVPKPEYFGKPRSAGVDGGRVYAVILSGGADRYNNHIRYYNDVKFIYTTLKEVYGYVDEDIYVLMSDGKDPAPDRSDGTNSPPDLDGDGVDDIDYPASRAAISTVFSALTSKITANDQLYVFFTDHGGSNGGWSTYLYLWNWELLQDYEFKNYINGLARCRMIFTMEQCYSGGFEDDLQTYEPRVFSSACAYSEYSWAMSNLLYDEYVYYWTSAVRGEDPYGKQVDADYDKSGVVEMDEAFQYANLNDTRPETPQYDSKPTQLGEEMTLFWGAQGPRLELVVSNYPSLVRRGFPFSYDIQVTNKGDSLYTTDCWVEIQGGNLPPGFTVKIINNVPLQPGQTKGGTFKKIVPKSMVPDEYFFYTRVGDYPDVIADEASFSTYVVN